MHTYYIKCIFKHILNISMLCFSMLKIEQLDFRKVPFEISPSSIVQKSIVFLPQSCPAVLVLSSFPQHCRGRSFYLLQGRPREEVSSVETSVSQGNKCVSGSRRNETTKVEQRPVPGAPNTGSLRISCLPAAPAP